MEIEQEGSEYLRGNCAPVYVTTVEDFDEEIFRTYVLEQRQPVVIKNAHKIREDAWNLDILRLAKYSQLDTSVRYMEVDNEDLGIFKILKDENKSLVWYLDNAQRSVYDPDNDPHYDPKWDEDFETSTSYVTMYAKDFSFEEHVAEWKDALLDTIPECVQPFNNPESDMLFYLPETVRPITLMGYIGVDGTRTPLHVDKLCTIAFNLFACGEGVKHWWFISGDSQNELIDMIRQRGNTLQQDNVWFDPNELIDAGLIMFYYKQELGDLVIVPPAVSHEVLNEGEGISCALAGNVFNFQCMSDGMMAIEESRKFSTNPVYKLKAVIYYAMLQEIAAKNASKLSDLMPVYAKMISEEKIDNRKLLIDPNNAINSHLTQIKNDTDNLPHQRICDMCKADIFNRRFSCEKCVDNGFEDFDLCIPCCYQYLKDQKHNQSQNLLQRALMPDDENPVHTHSLTPVQKFSIEHLQKLLKEANEIVGASGQNNIQYEHVAKHPYNSYVTHNYKPVKSYACSPYSNGGGLNSVKQKIAQAKNVFKKSRTNVATNSYPRPQQPIHHKSKQHDADEHADEFSYSPINITPKKPVKQPNSFNNTPKKRVAESLDISSAKLAKKVKVSNGMSPVNVSPQNLGISRRSLNGSFSGHDVNRGPSINAHTNGNLNGATPKRVVSRSPNNDSEIHTPNGILNSPNTGTPKRTKTRSATKNPTWTDVLLAAAKQYTACKIRESRKNCLHYFSRKELTEFMGQNWEEVSLGKRQTPTWANTISAALTKHGKEFFKFQVDEDGYEIFAYGPDQN